MSTSKASLSVPLIPDEPNITQVNNLSNDVLSDSDFEPNDVPPSSSLWTKITTPVTNFWSNSIIPNAGVFLLLNSQFFNSIMVTTCKLLVTDKDFDVPIHPLQILFVRMFITYICCALYMVVTKSVDNAPWGPREIRHLLVLRGLIGFVGVYGLYYSLQYLSLSDAVAITFLIPMVTAFLAWTILHERYSFLEAICGLLSLGGVLLIAKPDFLFGKESQSETSVGEGIESSSTELRLLASGVGLMGVLGASGVYIILRKIGKRAHPLLSVSYFALSTCIVTFVSLLVIPSLSFILPENSRQWMLFFLIGLSGFIMQFSLTAGVQRVKASKSSLMIYTNMIFAVFWDLTIWGHFPGLLSLLGIIVIITNAYVVIKYKKNDDDDLPNDVENAGDAFIISNDDEEEADKYNDNISLQDFTMTDESEAEHEGHNKVRA